MSETLETTGETTRLVQRGAGFVRRGDGPDPVDIHVGERLRRLRKQCGLSQMELAASIGVTFQQLQKYERGANRISCSRLHLISTVLGVPYGFLFDGLDGTDTPEETEAAVAEKIETTRAGLVLMRNFNKLSGEQKVSVMKFVKALAEMPGAVRA